MTTNAILSHGKDAVGAGATVTREGAYAPGIFGGAAAPPTNIE